MEGYRGCVYLGGAWRGGASLQNGATDDCDNTHSISLSLLYLSLFLLIYRHCRKSRLGSRGHASAVSEAVC